MTTKNTVAILDDQLGRGKKPFLIDATAVTSQNFYAIHFVTESVINSITVSGLAASSAAATILQTTIPAGTVLFLNVTAIDLTSGVAVGYTN